MQDIRIWDQLPADLIKSGRVVDLGDIAEVAPNIDAAVMDLVRKRVSIDIAAMQMGGIPNIHIATILSEALYGVLITQFTADQIGLYLRQLAAEIEDIGTAHGGHA